MKNFKFFFAAFMLLAASCSNESVEQSVEQTANQAQAPISVRVDGFVVSQEDISSSTRATAVGSYSGVSFLTLAFYASNGTEVYKSTQAKTEADFGEFSLSLPLGSYTMVVLGYALYGDDALTLTSPTQAEYTVGSPRETFAATRVVNITSYNAVNLSATLERIVAQLKVISSDNRTENVSNVRMTFAAGGKRFSPTSGLATVNTGFSSTVGISTEVGAKSGSISNIFLATDEQTMDVTIETLDAEGAVLFTKTVNDVPLKRNRITKLTGSIYPTAASATAGSFQVDTDWLPDHNMNF